MTHVFIEDDEDPLFHPDAFTTSPTKDRRKARKGPCSKPKKIGKRLSDLFDINNVGSGKGSKSMWLFD
jgi:hypothetical protein